MILLLVPLRTIVVPRLPFTEEELAILDRPTASPFVSCLGLVVIKHVAYDCALGRIDYGECWRVHMRKCVDEN